MISTNNLTIQFGAKPLFENVSVKFGDGNRYGLIGANGSGKSTLMKIIGGDLEPSSGNVALEPGLRLGKLRQDQFAFEDVRVLDVVMMGHVEMWQAMADRDAIYANPEATEDDYMRATELEGKFAEYDGYTAEARAGELLLGLEIPVEQHQLPMREIAPGWKLRVLLAQALFSNPDVLLLDEPTNNLDINTIRWLETVLNGYDSTMIIISHDRHFLNEVCTHMADLDYGELRVYPGNYDDYMLASDPGARAPGGRQCPGQGARHRTAGLRAPLRRQQIQVAPGHVPPEADRPHQGRDRPGQAVLAPESLHPLRAQQGSAPPGRAHRGPVEVLRPAHHPGLVRHDRGRPEDRHHRRQRGRARRPCCGCWPATWRPTRARCAGLKTPTSATWRRTCPISSIPTAICSTG